MHDTVWFRLSKRQKVNTKEVENNKKIYIKGGLGISPNLKVKHMKNSKRKFCFFLCFLLFFASGAPLAMLATVEGRFMPHSLKDRHC